MIRFIAIGCLYDNSVFDQEHCGAGDKWFSFDQIIVNEHTSRIL